MSAALLDHLWQSSLFAICAWSLTWVLRKNGAHLRHAVWVAASAKFLVPFSLLAMLGQQMQPYVGSEAAHVVATLGTASVTALVAAPAHAITGGPIGAFWLRIAAAVWLIGFLGLSVRWLVRWRGVREILRASVPVLIAAPVPVRTSAGLREPGVVGIVRPVLLLPSGITTRLTSPQFDAVLRHELCHL